jgi:hypothetical protein
MVCAECERRGASEARAAKRAADTPHIAPQPEPSLSMVG